MATAGTVLAVLAAAPPAAASSDPWSGLARAAAGVWASGGLQLDSGGFADYLHGGRPGFGGYGEGMLGYGLLQVGLRESDPAAVDAGLAAVGYAIREPHRLSPSVFEAMALASAYNLVRRTLPDHPRVRELAPAWERWLSSFPVVHLGKTTHFGNKHLVEAVAAAELSRTGLPVQLGAAEAGALLARLGDRTARTAGTSGRQRLRSLSDPGANPLAYHALATGMLARLVDLDAGADRRAVDLLVQGVEASVALQAPDGDIAYSGRSQAQVWALPFTAYGALVAARHAPARAARYRALAGGALARLRSAHAVGDQGFPIVPVLGPDPSAGRATLDEYAGNGVYNGLALVALNWTLEAAAGGAGMPAARAARAPRRAGGTVFPFQDGRFAVGSTRRAWYAVRGRSAVLRAGRFAGDLRQDFGLAKALVRRGGRWIEAVPQRPRTDAGPDSMGPLLLGEGRVGFPDSTRMRVRRGAVVARGGFRDADGRWLRRGVRFRWEPAAAGVRMSVPMRAGDTVEYSVLLTGTPARIDKGVRGSGQDVIVTGPTLEDVAFEGGHTSATQAGLTRARMTFRAARRTKLHVLTVGR